MAHMGFVDKIKNLFTEEEEVVVEPVKKEVIQVEIPAPTRENAMQTPTPTVEETKKEDKFSFPVFFDDKDFESLDKPKKEKKPEKKVTPVPKKEEAYQARGTKFEEKRSFKPSPIISPVYGILDKNYKKDDITDKVSYVDETYHHSRKMDIDDVRRKAFGTLEDEIDTAFEESELPLVERETYEDDTPNLEQDIMGQLDSESTREEDPLDVLAPLSETDEKSDEFDMLGNSETDDNMVSDAMEEDLKKADDLNLNESDLFNLIDSMYEKREEEEDD